MLLIKIRPFATGNDGTVFKTETLKRSPLDGNAKLSIPVWRYVYRLPTADNIALPRLDLVVDKHEQKQPCDNGIFSKYFCCAHPVPVLHYIYSYASF